MTKGVWPRVQRREKKNDEFIETCELAGFHNFGILVLPRTQAQSAFSTPSSVRVFHPSSQLASGDDRLRDSAPDHGGSNKTDDECFSGRLPRSDGCYGMFTMRQGLSKRVLWTTTPWLEGLTGVSSINVVLPQNVAASQSRYGHVVKIGFQDFVWT